MTSAKLNIQSVVFNLKFIRGWRTVADETLSICSASTRSPPSSPSCSSPGEAAAARALQVEGWWLHCWTESDAHGAVIPAVINIWSLPCPIPFPPHVKYPRATLSPHFNYSLKVISGRGQYFLWVHYTWIRLPFRASFWGKGSCWGIMATMEVVLLGVQ